MKYTAFTTYHPVTNFIFFALVLVLTVVIFHPLALAVSLAGALALAIKLNGRQAAKYFCGLPLFIMLLSVIINLLFVHKGITVLFYIGESPVTKEAALYGLVTAMMLGAVIMWFYCYSQIMTSDRFMAVFSKRAPASSLIFSMVLRFLPRMRRQAADIAMAQRCLGRSVREYSPDVPDISKHVIRFDENATSSMAGRKDERMSNRLSGGLAVTSMLTTWALENSIDTADSMRARGYGCGRRSYYSKYEAKPRDVVLSAAIISISAGLMTAKALGAWAFSCYPLVTISTGNITSIMSVLMAALCLCPLMIELIEEIRWKR